MIFYLKRNIQRTRELLQIKNQNKVAKYKSWKRRLKKSKKLNESKWLENVREKKRKLNDQARN